MRFRFASKQLKELYTLGKNPRGFSTAVVNAFLRRVRHIEHAKDERDLRIPKSVHFEKLKKGPFKGKSSFRLNKKWRLIVSIEKKQDLKTVIIHSISKHYE